MKQVCVCGLVEDSVRGLVECVWIGRVSCGWIGRVLRRNLDKYVKI